MTMAWAKRGWLCLAAGAAALAGLTLGLAAEAGADTPLRASVYVCQSPGGRVSLEMTPAEPRGESGRGRGLARDKASGRVLYSLDWYASRGKAIPLDDGLGVIRLGPWAGDRLGLSDLAVAFYRQGREIKRYRVSELLRDRGKIIRTASHYFWMDRDYPLGLSPDQRLLTIFLVDGGVVQFATASGARVEPKDLASMAQARQVFVRAEQLRSRGDTRAALPLYQQSLRLWPNLFLEEKVRHLR